MKVHPEGKPTSPLWIVGEAPGVDEAACGRPFVGSAGQQLNRLLSPAGIVRGECYLTNILDERPGPNSNDFGLLYHDKKREALTDRLVWAWAGLRKSVIQYAPRCIICLGEEPMRALIGNRGITNHRGSIYKFQEGTYVAPTFHPSYIMRGQWKWRAPVIADLANAKAISLSGHYPLPDPSIITMPNLREVKDFLREAGNAERTAIDIETAGPVIQCIGVSWDKDIGMSIPLTAGTPTACHWSEHDEGEVWRAIADFLLSPTRKVYQNAAFDHTWLKHLLGLPVRNMWMDTMLAHHILYPELPKSLQFQTAAYTHYPYYKGEGKTTDYTELASYNVKDAIVTWIISHELEKQLQQHNLWLQYNSLTHALIEPVCAMVAKGLRIDTAAREEADVLITEHMDELLIKMREEIKEPRFNPRSPKQTAAVVYDKYKVSKRRDRSTNKKILKPMAERSGWSFLHDLIEYREQSSLRSTFIRMPLADDGRLHTSYNIAGTNEGRWSSSAWIMSEKGKGKRQGGNLQNVPKGPARRVIIPDEDGWIMLGVDLSKADARVVAGLSEDPDYIAVYEDPTHDPYFVIAALIYGLTYEQVVGDDAKYKVGKKLTHATHYGGTEKTIAVNCGMPLNEASRAYRAIHNAFPGIRSYIEWVEHEVRYKKVLYNIFGRRRIFLDIWSSQMAAQALAWIPASSVADYQHLALASAHRALPPPARVCLEIHDAFVITLPPSLEDECRTVLANAFDITVPIKGRPTKIPYEIKVGVNWDEV